MRPQEIIRKKRDGAALTREEIAAFVRGVTDGSWADYQISALIMACFTRGLNADEAAHLTQEMLHSGEVLDFSDLDAPKADKHSTGGVGDKTSLIIAPLAAACGLAVPMISGRGLGHTGGTLDKLESIAGYNVNLSLDEFKKVIKKCGFAMTGPTAEIAPADKKLYALRDATATVEYIPLIVASIMSKKLAEGLDALVLDVKTGNGAFMPEFEKAKELALAMCRTGISCNVATQAVISDMSQPLGKYVGNALEVYECVKIMRGEMEAGFEQTLELSIELTARMLMLTGIAKDLETARKLCETKLRDGSALQKFQQNIELQGGDPRICDQPDALLDKNLQTIEIKSPRSGFITEINTQSIGEAISNLGGGRIKVEDQIDFQVGFASEAKIGDFIEENQTIGVLYCRAENKAVFSKLQKAYLFAENTTTKPKMIRYVTDFVRKYVEMDKLSFDEWVDFIFNHEPKEEVGERWYNAEGFYYKRGKTFAPNCIKLFKDPEFLLEKYTPEQLDEGFFGFILDFGISQWLWNKEINADLRKEFILSSVNVFKKLFTKNPLTHACFMWWDSLRYFNEDGDERVNDWMFEALSQILKIDSFDCQLSALHGLGHLEHNAKKDLINSFLANNFDFPEKEYALAAIEGKVL